jgi:tellurite resistance-related uncharacterized protein
MPKITVMKKNYPSTGKKEDHPTSYDHIAEIAVNAPMSETALWYMVRVLSGDYAVQIEGDTQG